MDPKSPDAPSYPPAASAGLVFGILGPAVLWLTQFQVIYTAARWACSTGHRNVIPVTSGISFLIAAAFAWHAVASGRRARTQPDDQRQRSEFMAHVGIMMTALFALGIVAQGIAILFVDPCKL